VTPALPPEGSDTTLIGGLAAAQTVGLHFLGPPAGGRAVLAGRSVPFLTDALLDLALGEFKHDG